MDGPLSDSKISHVILGTLKPDKQALRITSIEASLYKRMQRMIWPKIKLKL